MLSSFARTPGWCALIATVGVGCGDGVDVGKNNPVTGITGTAIDTFVTDTGEVAEPADPADIAVSAVVPGDGDGATTYQGVLDPQGNISIEDVPEGSYALHVTHAGAVSVFTTDARELDLGAVYLGRHESAFVSSSATELLLDIEGLAPWQETDMLYFFSLGACAWTLLSVAAPPDVGATSLNGAIPYTDFWLPALVEADKGDRAMIAQLVTKQSGATSYQSLAKVFVPEPFTIVDGEATAVSGSFVDVPQNQVPLDWRRSEFAALASSVHPLADDAGLQYLFAFPDPGGSASGGNWVVVPTLFELWDNAPVDLDLDLAFGNPFPATWPVLGEACAIFSASLPSPEGGEPVLVSAEACTYAPLGAFASAPVAPVVHPPEAILLDGEDATLPRSAVGAAPTLAWSPPSGGAPPASYRVHVMRVQDDTAMVWAATIVTTDTTAVIPAGVLEWGERYVVMIASESVNDPSKPFGTPPAVAWAQAMTGVFTP